MAGENRDYYQGVGNELFGITRNELGKHHFWSLRLGEVEDIGIWFSSTFPDRPWGGKEKALNACKIKRDEIMVSLEMRQYYKL